MLWGVAVSGTTNTFFKPASTGNGLTVGSFHWPLVLMQQSQRQNVVAQSTVLAIASLTLSIWTLLSVTASQWGVLHYALILVDQATCYTWVYGMKDLSSDSILLALCNFKADTGSYARCFRSDCDAKLFGKRIRDHLIDNNSNIVAAAAGRQLANGLVESHWKTMVHMSRAYLTEK